MLAAEEREILGQGPASRTQILVGKIKAYTRNYRCALLRADYRCVQGCGSERRRGEKAQRRLQTEADAELNFQGRVGIHQDKGKGHSRCWVLGHKDMETA